MRLSILELEAAINACRAASPSAVDGLVLSADARALAGLYGEMIYYSLDEVVLKDAGLVDVAGRWILACLTKEG